MLFHTSLPWRVKAMLALALALGIGTLPALLSPRALAQDPADTAADSAAAEPAAARSPFGFQFV